MSDEDTISKVTPTKESAEPDNPWAHATVTYGSIFDPLEKKLKDGLRAFKSSLHPDGSDRKSAKPASTNGTNVTPAAPDSSAGQTDHTSLTSDKLAEHRLNKVKSSKEGCQPRGPVLDRNDLTIEGLERRFPNSKSAGTTSGRSGA